MINSDEWFHEILKLTEDSSFQVEVFQIRAKALLKDVFKKLPAYKWTYVTNSIIRNISVATFLLQKMSREGVKYSEDYEKAARQIALTWESLAKLKEKTSEKTALMNAAISYEIAGYQANAACLAKKLDVNFYEFDLPTISDLASKFLQRNFLQVMLLAKRLISEPEIDENFQNTVLEKIALAGAGQGFITASNHFLTGKITALEKAKTQLKNSGNAFDILGMQEESNLIKGISSLLPVISKNSIWTVLTPKIEDNPKWIRYLKLLARGPGRNILNTPSVCELWPSQINALEKGLLDSLASKIVKMPTSSGKTRIAEMAIVHTLVKEPGSKCVYIAPYRSLVYELEQTFLLIFGDLGYNVSSIMGSYETDDFEELLTKDADILVLTPEKLDLLQRAQPEFLDNVRLFVMDEGQIVQDNRRGIKFELLLTRLKRKLPKARFLFLSAVVPYETLKDFAQWFNAKPDEDVITTEWRPSIQRVAKFEWDGSRGVIKYSPDEDIQLLQEFVPFIIEQKTYRYENSVTKRMNTERFPEKNNRVHTAAELAYRFAELGPVLIFCSQPNFVEAVAKSLEHRLNLAGKRNENIPSYFLNGESTRSYHCAKEWLGPAHQVTSFFKKGIAIHHGKLPSVLKNAIEKDFRNRKFKVIIATNTLAQGVNLPIRTVIIHSCRRFNRDINRQERIPAMDYWNIAGRAGRAGRETEGTIIHIVMNEKNNSDYYHYLKHRKNVEPLTCALFKMLQDLMDERLDKEIIKDSIDAEILALLVEEQTDNLSEVQIREILNESLVQKQTSRNHQSLDTLINIFSDTAEDVIDRIPNKSYWPIYSSTGLRSKSCEIIRKYIQSNKEQMKGLFLTASYPDLNELIEIILEICNKIPEMQINQSFSGHYSQLLDCWIRGTSISDIVQEFGRHSQSSEDLAKLVEKFFTQRLPWGTSAIIRIAIKELKINKEQVSDYVSFLPTMIKFGVPLPVATWAFSLGIPFRKSAIDLATKYLEETNTPTFEEFREWVNLDQEELREKFDFEGIILEDISQALSFSSSNRYLKTYSTSEQILPYETDIMGIKFSNHRIVASQARYNQSVALLRDYDNILDRNAIKIQLEGNDLGYIKRDLAQLLAPDIDCGLKLVGKIVSINKETIPKIRILIETDE